MALKDELRLMREAKGMAQADLADAIGVCSTTVYNRERGASKPNFRKLRIIAKILGVSEQELLHLREEENEDTNNVQ